MRQYIEKDDYIGFLFGNYHSSQFGLKSVTKGNRYSNVLFPKIKENKTTHTNIDGTFYYGTQYQEKTFDLNLAFDDVTEREYREMIQWLSQDEQDLIFDERPYIQYKARLQKAPTIKSLTFMEKYDRIYKGEISLTFVCYECFGTCVNKWTDNYSPSEIDIKLQCYNVEEWSYASGLKENANKNGLSYYDVFSEAYNKIPVYNPGDIDADWILTIPYASSTQDITLALQKDVDDEWVSMNKSMSLNFSEIPDTYIIDENTYITESIVIDTKRHFIYTIANSGSLTDQQVVNYCWIGGDFFQIPASLIDEYAITCVSLGAGNPTIEYNYKYL